MRIGLGYDLHRLESGHRLVLAGVEIDHPQGLVGHSDADVVFHALVDAILGAAGLEDIGTHFPDTDPAWQGTPGAEFLARTLEMLPAKWTIGNVDVNILAESVRIAPHRNSMRQNLARALGIDAQRVNVKGKTGEGVGPVGRNEAIEAQVVVLLEERENATG